MIKEAVILAGGLGIRLRSAVPDLPKCMASVNGKPFLAHVMDHFQKQGIEKFIFSLGYKHEIIEYFINAEYSDINSQFCIESEPLGTGGAITSACSKATEKSVLIINGDTLFKIDVSKLSVFHNMCGADCTLSLKLMQKFDRYGRVELSEDNSIKKFSEKEYCESGLINGGIYALNVINFLQENLPEKFSFEKDYLEKYFHERRIYGVIQDEYFIDIGIPVDYEKAQNELK